MCVDAAQDILAGGEVRHANLTLGTDRLQQGDEVRPRSQRGETAAQVRELGTQDVRGEALQPPSELRGRIGRRALGQQVDVIGQHFQREHGDLQLRCLGQQQPSQALRCLTGLSYWFNASVVLEMLVRLTARTFERSSSGRIH